ncbi:MAG: cysteine--tRNA ligase [Christensenellales bacterium]
MKIYNTMTREKEEFVPIKDGHVALYACGPTVYNYFHIGNARPFIIFDTLRRYLEYRGYKVTFVQNFTDIDDKMINRANQEGITVSELAGRFIEEYYKDADALGIRRATVNPKATEHIGEIITLIQRLIDNRMAYASGGDVYFSVESFPAYGKLSRQPLDNLSIGIRIEAGDIKKHPMDFALWKAQKPGEPAWESPWGLGRPGWHVECSAMSMKYLGESFDIHGGGQDLIFPHHENEIAQSEGATGKPFARYWMHNGYINVDNQKMSKSLNNFFTVRDIAAEYDLQAVRMFMLFAHYRNPVNFSHDMIEQAKNALYRLHNAYDHLAFVQSSGTDAKGAGDELFLKKLQDYKQAFIDAMDDDLNTADALAALFEIARECNTYFAESGSKIAASSALALYTELLQVLGLQKKEEEVPKEIQSLVEKRQQARKDKNWALSDAIRDELKQKGYAVEDTAQGPKIKKLS